MARGFLIPLLSGLAILGSLNWMPGAQVCFQAAAKPMRTINMQLTVSSSAFRPGQTMAKKYTADGNNLSPPLTWTAPPKETKSLALICDDPDAPAGTWVHWVIYAMPNSLNGLEEAMPPEKILLNGVRQGINSFGKIGYGGPSPPPGRPHRYFFKLYALDSELKLESGATAKQIEQAIAGHILAEGQLIGIYGR